MSALTRLNRAWVLPRGEVLIKGFHARRPDEAIVLARGCKRQSGQNSPAKSCIAGPAAG